MTPARLRDFSSAILVDRGGRLLLQLRDNKPDIAQPGRISFFGGQREKQETPLQCIVREISEEIGAKLSQDDFHHLLTLDAPDPENVDGHVKGTYFVARGLDSSTLEVTEGALVIVEPEGVRAIRDNLTPLTTVVLNCFLASQTTRGHKIILFLCTGNYYRSRFAEELFNYLAEREQLPWRAFSRGAAEKRGPQNVGPISAFALEALQAKGVSPKRATGLPRPCTQADLDRADIVIGLKRAEHESIIERRFPRAAGRVLYWQIHDIDVAHPTIALPQLERMVANLVSILKMRDSQNRSSA
ncbi:arsenate reductase/protein-tyrosine-phosphatase family protein [Bradyrhizobium centrosematis]|uniref:arsenate reductase/protein-tyrosine-phosphatase family protein n=1 Tax=Bradyrhizobium centrosematis TaxID=1300039 RepID=UPI0021690EB9|nr:NUDIX domain-containing protein [Bradyrhizobium centrosematis]MCS3765342.1 protein-tyrosine-phosphatase/8-oxo-dGTP pyrophosphatase MutT (NUDIX family) [Bradyrhizobium centrosematis]MCS3773958.1 protein-tyrosine-phosphatase/8-oxo-dGTP pyrophosphatase MutT (NUDIX family) [Bradyrhizobium centrosematis]